MGKTRDYSRGAQGEKVSTRERFKNKQKNVPYCPESEA